MECILPSKFECIVVLVRDEMYFAKCVNILLRC